MILELQIWKYSYRKYTNLTLGAKTLSNWRSKSTRASLVGKQDWALLHHLIPLEIILVNIFNWKGIDSVFHNLHILKNLNNVPKVFIFPNTEGASFLWFLSSQKQIKNEPRIDYFILILLSFFWFLGVIPSLSFEKAHVSLKAVPGCTNYRRKRHSCPLTKKEFNFVGSSGGGQNEGPKIFQIHFTGMDWLWAYKYFQVFHAQFYTNWGTSCTCAFCRTWTS